MVAGACGWAFNERSTSWDSARGISCYGSQGGTNHVHDRISYVRNVSAFAGL